MSRSPHLPPLLICAVLGLLASSAQAGAPSPAPDSLQPLLVTLWEITPYLTT